MLTPKELIRTPEYWHEKIQNDLYKELMAYMKVNNINRSELAKEWDVSKGYVSQVMNGNFNFTMLKLIELALHMHVAPVMDFKPIGELDGFNVVLKPGGTAKLPLSKGKTCRVVSLKNSMKKNFSIPYKNQPLLTAV